MIERKVVTPIRGERMEELVPMLKALADDTRWKILQMLSQRTFCVRALAKRLALTEAAISQHLKVLREAGFLEGERCGHYVHYRVRSEALKKISLEIGGIASAQRGPKSDDCDSGKREPAEE